MPLSAESCDLNCVRRRSEKRLRKTIRTLRKSINREQFHLHFAGSDYEHAKSSARPAELPGHCAAGQVLVGRKCGELDFLRLLFNTETCVVRTCTNQPGIPSAGYIDAFKDSRASMPPPNTRQQCLRRGRTHTADSCSRLNAIETVHASKIHLEKLV